MQSTLITNEQLKFFVKMTADNQRVLKKKEFFCLLIAGHHKLFSR